MEIAPLITANQQTYREAYGEWALVTGAAEGIGAEFATQLAAQGLNIILADVQLEKAQQHALDLAQQYGVKTVAVECDLSQPSFIDQLLKQTADLAIGFLICCAGIGATGAFSDTPLEAMHKAIQVNCMATVTLCHHFSPAMLERHRGAIIIVASNSAYAGAPYIANYAATKAYDLSLAEALWYEFKPLGIDVLGFSPQGTNTPGMRRGMPSLSEGEAPEGIMLADEAVRFALGQLGKIASIRPDLPKEYSLARQEVTSTAGDFTRTLAVHKG